MTKHEQALKQAEKKLAERVFIDYQLYPYIVRIVVDTYLKAREGPND